MSLDPRDQRIAELEQVVAKRDARIAALEQTVVTLQETVATLLGKIQDLEERLNRNSSNSSTPPSANPPGAPKLPAKKSGGRKAGGQPGHKGHHRAMVEPDRVVEHRPVRCGHCQGEFTGDERTVGTPLKHQVTEIPPIKPIVTEHRLHRCLCACGKSTRAPHPQGVPTGQFGPRIVALAALLGGRYRITRREMVALFQDGFGVSISVGTAQALCEQAAFALAKPYEEIKAAVLAQDVVHADETSSRHKGKKTWLWVASGRMGAVFRLDPARSKEARRRLLPDDYPGVVSCDRYAVYADHARRQLCHAHPQRNWQAITERKHPEAKRLGTWAVEETRRLLRLHRKLRVGVLDRASFRKSMRMVQARYGRLLNQALECGDKKAESLAKELNAQWGDLWTFVEVEGVEPTNNEAEREIRPAVLWRKVSLGTQSEMGQRFVERMLTMKATARKLGVSLLGFVQRAVDARLHHLPAPSIYAQ